MTRSPFPILFLLLAVLTVNATAQPAQTNVSVFITPQTERSVYVKRVPVGTRVLFDTVVQWHGSVIPENFLLEVNVPGTLLSVDPSDDTYACSGAQPLRCRISPRTARSFSCIVLTTDQPSAGNFTASAVVSTTTREELVFDNRREEPLQVTDRPSLSTRGWLYPLQIDPSKPGIGTAELANDGATAPIATLTLTLPNGGTFTAARPTRGIATCSVEPAKTVCTARDLSFGDGFGVNVDVLAPDSLDGGHFVIHQAVSSTAGETDPSDNEVDVKSLLVAHMLVTNTNDDGSGSLRQAIRDAEVRCATHPCAIAFRIPAPVPEEGGFTIRPLTPLPDVRGLVRVDGRTQTELTGDTNTAGPEIEINGSLQQHGHGLVIHGVCDSGVMGVAMNGFPRHAIEVQWEPLPGNANCPVGSSLGTVIRDNYLGTDPRGLTALPNEHGIVVPNASHIDITENLISGNRRAGIFLGDGYLARVSKNRIGINANGEPLGNGASGIFVNFGAGADIDDNIIAFNGEWGVCRTSRGEVALRRNSIYGNTSQGLDINLDNETPNRPNDSTSFPNKPVLFSASYDAASDTTIVRGRIDSNLASSYPSNHTIEVYASSSLSVWGYPQGETLIATSEIFGIVHTEFEIAAKGDWRGKFITATHTRSHIIGLARTPGEQSHQGSGPADTSEFSNAIEVR